MTKINKKENDIIIDNYKKETLKKVRSLDINLENLKNIVQKSWDQIFTISDNENNIILGKNLFPKPQMMGYFLEVLIAKNFIKKYGSEWSFDPTGYSKDITNTKNDDKSIEIKTSSSKNNIFGNRSYAEKNSKSKKSKESLYIAINFEKFYKNNDKLPNINLIRIGYLKKSDWIPQSSSSGQQSRLNLLSKKGKLLEIWPNKDDILKEQ